ncbi:hypothetical protein Tco_0652363 [Tanacetum coccineum]|uniref:Uncharacterized protein n=1 Tax=Tanacetum coccineum TaxID=301880 RepID=A0ABQ4WXD6_9ASTR
MDYFISVHSRSDVRFSASFLDPEEKSSFYPNDFPSMILQKIICVSKVGKQLLPTNITYLYVCPAIGSTCADIMANLNVPVNDAPWNKLLAFTTSSTIPAIYIQQFWDTMCFNSSTGLYSCQLDEQWFNLHKDILRDALNITPANDNNPFVAPPSSDTVIEYVNTLGYPNTLKNVSAMSVNALYQPWRAILSMINMCLTGKTAGFDRPRHPVLQMLWGIIHHSNIDYVERIWEGFVQSMQTFLTDRKNLATVARGKKKTAHLLIPSVRSVRKDDEECGKSEKGGATECSEATKVTKHKAEKATKPAGDKAPKPAATQPPKPKPAPTQPSKVVSEKKRKLVKEIPDEPSPAKTSKGVPVEEPAYNKEDADLERALELSLIDQWEQTQGPAHL